MNFNRRNFLLFLGATAGAIASESYRSNSLFKGKSEYAAQAIPSSQLGFQPVKVPLPLEIESLSREQQSQIYSSYEVIDDLVLPPGYTYDLIAVWGDRLGDSRFGYNNDYLSLTETGVNEAYLTVNFEYLSGGTWMTTYPLVMRQELPFAELITLTEATSGQVDAFSLEENDPLKAKIRQVCWEGLIDLGLGVMSIRRNADGQWQRSYSDRDRRVSGVTGLDQPELALKSTGAAVAVFNKSQKLGYEDHLGDRIIGTLQNCSGGTTPWGTVLSAEENFQDQVPEAVKADGSAFEPSSSPFFISSEELGGMGNVFGLAGNKYGWMVEIDPANPQDYGTKHTWLGRYRHEGFGVRAIEGKKLAVYSGCDRRGGHLYKFVSQEIVQDPKNPANSRLFELGMLYGAKFDPQGTGEWIPLKPDTLVNPVLPSQVVGGMVILPQSDRTQGGVMEITSDLEIQSFVKQFKTLKDLYQGNSEAEIQGAILIDAHFAATAGGVTCTARPEGTIIQDDGTLLIAFTSGSSGSDGSPDGRIFVAVDGKSEYEYGWVMQLAENEQDPASLSFKWSILATGGEPASAGAGFANPDNLGLDPHGNLWIVTDMSTSKHNQALPARTDEIDPNQDLTGIFGNNTLWYLPLSGETAGQIYPFAIGPMECECTGITFAQDNQSLFLAVQHPGEQNALRQNLAAELREFALLTTDGTPFKQQRQVPLGSNWPSKQVNQPPLPGVVAIRRVAGGELTLPHR